MKKRDKFKAAANVRMQNTATYIAACIRLACFKLCPILKIRPTNLKGVSKWPLKIHKLEFRSMNGEPRYARV